MPETATTGNDEYYCISEKSYGRSEPSVMDDLLIEYGLKSTMDYVARFHPVTGEKNKLRKSYKNQILDLRLKQYEIPTNGNTLLPIAYSAAAQGLRGESPIKPLDVTLLRQNLNFEKTPATGVPGYDTSLLGLDTSSGVARNELLANLSAGGMTGDTSNDEVYSGGGKFIRAKRKRRPKNAGGSAASDSDSGFRSAKSSDESKRRKIY